VDLVVGLLAVLKAGAGYLPLDPRHPSARLRDILDDAGCGLVVGDAEPCRLLLGSGRVIVRLDEPPDGEPDDAPRTEVRPANVAYVIYTSGSTGTPKGVAVTHANVTRLFAATERDFGFGPDDVWTLFHSIAFDFSVWELWGALLHGGRLVVVPYLMSRDPAAFLDLLCAHRVTVLNQTPTAFRELAAAAEDAGFPRLDVRVVVLGGEALDPATLRGWVGGYGAARPRLVNMYGITETTVHVTIRPIGIGDLAGSISPIGRPIGDLRVYLLDERMNEVPPGVEGEIYVGGPGVARGYLNRPVLTRERFVPDPFGAAGERLYRSGDLAVRLPNGELEYRGRGDQQVKLRGFRVELGEIERALLDQPDVRGAACALREDTPGLPRLVAYLVPAPGRRPSPETIRGALADRLPAHMIPAAFVRLSSLPLTTNGKLDRARLPGPGAEGDDARDTSARTGAAGTATERMLAGIWRQVLGVAEPDVHGNFFALGGDSIIAIRVCALARAAGLPVTVESLFLHPTVAELAGHCDRWGEDSPAAPPPLSTSLTDLDPATLPPDVVDAYPTAAMQLAILYECEFADDETSGLYRDLISVRLDGPFDRLALERALVTVCDRHEILRTSFRLGSFREPIQLVHRAARVPLTVDEHDPGDGGEPEAGTRESAPRRWWAEERARPFDLAQAPLIRCHVLRAGTRGFQLSLVSHHVILDGWSFARLMTELLQEYDRRLAGGGAALPPVPPTGYREFIAAEQAAQADPETRKFWETLLRSGAPAAPVPMLPGGPDEDGIAFRAPLPPTLETELDRVAGEWGLPVKSVFLAAHAWALARLTGHPEIATAVQVNGRLEREGADLVLGLLLNMLPVHLTIGDRTWVELADAAFIAERERQPYRRYPLAAMRQLMGRDHSLFEVAFNYTDFHAFDALDSLTRVRTADWWFADRHSFPLMLEVSRSPRSGRRVLEVTVGVGSGLAGSGVRFGELTLQALRHLAASPHARPS
jgi:amino acid adenylation domain-containing protein